MILVDTSVWIDHLRGSIAELANLLERNQVLGHPFVKGEIAMGSFKRRAKVLVELNKLPAAQIADHEEVVDFVSRHAINGLGVGFIDAHLLVAARLTPDAQLWTRDARLKKLAELMGVAYAGKK